MLHRRNGDFRRSLTAPPLNPTSDGKRTRLGVRAEQPHGELPYSPYRRGPSRAAESSPSRLPHQNEARHSNVDEGSRGETTAAGRLQRG
ncbi:hypothetical protein FQA47_010919 [Oryzias melastigma]|uniref:Uncharacterized protein n=1 Tax=Oryzias melastigma TaxID=30732 RepID=A0A834C5I8_ORYME|nr:hypothetical protein FQA47_010919 [Oryzias melastigma]